MTRGSPRVRETPEVKSRNFIRQHHLRVKLIISRETRRNYWELGLLLSVIDSGLVGSTDYGRGAARAEDAQGTPIQSHISPSTLVYEETRVGSSKTLSTLGDWGLRNPGDGGKSTWPVTQAPTTLRQAVL